MILDITWFLTFISLTVPLLLCKNGDPIRADDIVATVFNIRKKIICFYIWLIGDFCWFMLDYNSKVHGRAILDFVQIILSFCKIFGMEKGDSILSDYRKNGNFKTQSS